VQAVDKYRINRFAFGLRILFVQTSTIGVFDFQTLLVQLVSALALLGVAATIVDVLMLKILPQKKLYEKAKFDETEKFGEIRKSIREDRVRRASLTTDEENPALQKKSSLAEKLNEKMDLLDVKLNIVSEHISEKIEKHAHVDEDEDNKRSPKTSPRHRTKPKSPRSKPKSPRLAVDEGERDGDEPDGSPSAKIEAATTVPEIGQEL